MALKSSKSGRWSKQRKDISTVSTERWPTPSGGTDGKASKRGRRHASAWRNAARLTSLGWIIVLPIAAGILVGRLLDRLFGTQPYATIILLVAGVCLALIESYRTLAGALKVIRDGKLGHPGSVD